LRTLNDRSGGAGGPRVESGRLPDSSSSGGKEGFAAGGRKGHASRVRPTTGILGAISEDRSITTGDFPHIFYSGDNPFSYEETLLSQIHRLLLREQRRLSAGTQEQRFVVP
jgi:hypothetical protein